MSNENICGVCWNNVGENKVRTPCNHIYCTNCFFSWMKINRNCPSCRTSFDNDRIATIQETLGNLELSISIQQDISRGIRRDNDIIQRSNERLYSRNCMLREQVATKQLELANLDTERILLREIRSALLDCE